MSFLLKLIGILILVIGIAYILKPSLIHSFLESCKIGKKIYYTCAGKLAAGVILIITAFSGASIPWIPAIVGIAAMASGITVFVIKIEKATACINWWLIRPASTHKLAAFITTAVGALIILSAR